MKRLDGMFLAMTVVAGLWAVSMTVLLVFATNEYEYNLRQK